MFYQKKLIKYNAAYINLLEHKCEKAQTDMQDFSRCTPSQHLLSENVLSALTLPEGTLLYSSGNESA